MWISLSIITQSSWKLAHRCEIACSSKYYNKTNFRSLPAGSMMQCRQRWWRCVIKSSKVSKTHFIEWQTKQVVSIEKSTNGFSLWPQINNPITQLNLCIWPMCREKWFLNLNRNCQCFVLFCRHYISQFVKNKTMNRLLKTSWLLITH